MFATFDGIAYTESIVRMESRSILGALEVIRKELGKVADESLEVTVERDDGKRTVMIPDELEAVFGSSTEARTAFEKLSYSHQRKFVKHVREAKKPGNTAASGRANRGTATRRGPMRG